MNTKSSATMSRYSLFLWMLIHLILDWTVTISMANITLLAFPFDCNSLLRKFNRGFDPVCILLFQKLDAQMSESY